MALQSVIVVALVAAAAAFLAWRIIGPFLRDSPASGCHGCGTPCEMKTAARTKPCADPGAPVPARLFTPSSPERPR